MESTVRRRFEAPILECLENGQMDLALGLLAAGHDPDARNQVGKTALHEAVLMGDSSDVLHLVEKLVSAGADVNAAENDGLRPLHRAAVRGHTNMIRFLVEQGADLDAQDQKVFGTGLTPLHMAIVHRHAAALNLLIELGADVHRPAWTMRLNIEQSASALHLTAVYDEVDMFERLLAAGADPHALTDDRRHAHPPETVMDWAQAHRSHRVIRAIVELEQTALRLAIEDQANDQPFGHCADPRQETTRSPAVRRRM